MKALTPSGQTAGRKSPRGLWPRLLLTQLLLLSCSLPVSAAEICGWSTGEWQLGSEGNGKTRIATYQ
ncbi:MAG: hypothetical protein R3E95_21400, partial [Thiolinea sp.]